MFDVDVTISAPVRQTLRYRAYSLAWNDGIDANSLLIVVNVGGERHNVLVESVESFTVRAGEVN